MKNLFHILAHVGAIIVGLVLLILCQPSSKGAGGFGVGFFVMVFLAILSVAIWLVLPNPK